MSKPLIMIAVAGAASLMLGVASAQAAPAPTNRAGTPMLIQVSGGCGPYGWRGPMGGCRYGGRWRGDPGWGNGCPRGYWRGARGPRRHNPPHRPLAHRRGE